MTATHVQNLSPRYLDGRSHDELARMVLGLTSELWIVKDRLLALEAILEGKGVTSADEVDRHEPDARLEKRLATERERLLERVLDAPMRVGNPPR